MTKVLVFGGRDYSDKDKLYRVLDGFNKEYNITQVIQGYAHGADRMSHEWAEDRGIRSSGKLYQITPKDWDNQGRAAGPIRNQRMLDENPDLELFIGFPGGNGTLDMAVRATRSFGVDRVHLIGWDLKDYKRKDYKWLYR